MVEMVAKKKVHKTRIYSSQTIAKPKNHNTPYSDCIYNTLRCITSHNPEKLFVTYLHPFASRLFDRQLFLNPPVYYGAFCP